MAAAKARESGARKRARKSTASRSATRKTAAKKTSAVKTSAKKTSAGKTAAKKTAARKSSAKKKTSAKKTASRSPESAGSQKRTARAMWKGRLRFGDVEVPVKLYAAVESGAGVHFRLLHEKDQEPVEQQMVDPSTGKVVPNEEVRRAFQTEDGDLVMLDDDELESLEPTSSREIEITRFVDEGSIGHIWYDRPYYLGPDDDDEAYFALAEALRRQRKEGVARWVMRKKPYAGTLKLEGDHLMLLTLRHAGEVVAATELEAPGGRALDRREMRMAKQLVSALEDQFDASEFRDEYRDRVLELVEAKAEGKVVKFPEVARKPAERSLGDALERSLEAAKAARRKSG